jgi:fructose-bisphosphate aldolase class II
MPLVTMDALLRDAENSGYAVGAFNVVALDGLHAIADAASAIRSPVIISIAEIHFQYFDFNAISCVARKIADELPVPAVLHLDHGLNFETTVEAIRLGYTSVMFDGSNLPFEGNIATTRRVVDTAHKAGVSVEAELGTIGGAENGGSNGGIELTPPDKAVEFAERTGCDVLAVAIGTSHGVYKGEPNLDFERLREIRDLLDIPLALHGGTGLSDTDFRECIAHGIRKINIYTQLNIAAVDVIRDKLETDPGFIDFPALLVSARAKMQTEVERFIRLFGSAGSE